MTVFYSLGEIDALAKKAARGAGYSWGVAEEAGKATRWLSAYGLQGPEVLAGLLTVVSGDLMSHKPELSAKTDDQLIFQSKPDSQKGCCPIISGNLMNDLGHYLQKNKQISFSEVLFPLLSLPQIGRVAEAYQTTLLFSVGQTEVVVAPVGINLQHEEMLQVEAAKSVACTLYVNAINSEFKFTHQPSPKNRVISKRALEILENFAHKTYAPATEASRLLGAGAGVNDND